MNRTDILKKMSEATGISVQTADIALRAALNGMKESLAKGEKVSLTGFGTWSVVDRAARVGRNPKTGEPVNIPAKKRVKFSVGAPVTEAVNNPPVPQQ